MKKFVQEKRVLLTEEQLAIYERITESIKSSCGQIYVIDGPGDSGKTFLLNLLLAEVRSYSGLALASASSEIAATLLEEGRAAHATFTLPLNLNHVENPLCHISKQSNVAQVLRECKRIVWDESTMAHKGAFEAVDKTVRDVRNNSIIR